MTCTCRRGVDCSCTECPPVPDPVLPRCQVDLPDGVYTNATITVVNGCITAVADGEPFLYTPEVCCPTSTPGTGPGPSPEPGTPGPAGTMTVGTVNTLAAGSPATVVNVGTPNAAVLNFGIPAGAPGPATPFPPGGLTGDYDDFELLNGLVIGLPINWPPVTSFTGIGSPAGVSVTGSVSGGMLTVTVDISSYDAVVQGQLTALENAIIALQAQTAALCAGSACP